MNFCIIAVTLQSVLKQSCLWPMKMKYDKLDLTSDNFKAKRTPEKVFSNTVKGTLSNSPAYQSRQSQKIDPKDLFQKVCCPNCRYLFKIIKNTQVLFQQPTPKKSMTNAIAIQTQQVIVRELKALSKISNQLGSKMQSPRHTESAIFKSGLIKHNNISKSQIIKEPDHLKESSFRFPEKTPVKNISSRKPSNGFSENKSQLSALQESSKPRKKSIEKPYLQVNSAIKSSTAYLNEQKEKLQRRVRQEIRTQLSELPEILKSQMKNSKTIDHLVSFYAELPTTIQIPSYCKMLICDHEEKKQSKKNFKTNLLTIDF